MPKLFLTINPWWLGDWQRQVNPMKYPAQIYIYIYWWHPGIYYSCILLCKSIWNVKKHLTLLKNLQVKKNICFSVQKTFWFFSKFLRSIHQITFDHSVSCVLQIDKQNESCQNSKNFERNAISTTKKAFKKKRK